MLSTDDTSLAASNTYKWAPAKHPTKASFDSLLLVLIHYFDMKLQSRKDQQFRSQHRGRVDEWRSEEDLGMVTFPLAEINRAGCSEN